MFNCLSAAEQHVPTHPREGRDLSPFCRCLYHLPGDGEGYLSQKISIAKATAGVDTGLSREEVSHLVGRLSCGLCLEIPCAGTDRASSEGKSKPGGTGRLGSCPGYPNSPPYAGERVSDCQRKRGMALCLQVTGELMSWCQRPDSNDEIWPPRTFFSLTVFISWGGSGEGCYEWSTLLGGWRWLVMEARGES